MLLLSCLSLAAQGVRVVPESVYGRGAVTTSALSPDGRLLAVAAGPDVLLFDTASFAPVGSLVAGHPALLQTLVFDPTGAFLAAFSRDGVVTIWNVPERRKLGQYDADPDRAPQDRGAFQYYALFTPDSRLLRVWTRWNPKGTWYEIIGWDMEAMAAQRLSQGSGDVVRYQTLSPNTSRVTGAPYAMNDAVVSRDLRFVAGRIIRNDAEPETVGRWELWEEGEEATRLLVIPQVSVRFLRFSEDGRFLVVGTYDWAGVQIVDIAGRAIMPVSSLPYGDLASCGLSLRPDQLREIPALREGYVFAGQPLSLQLVGILPDEWQEIARSWVIRDGMKSCDAMPPEIEGRYRDGWEEIPILSYAYSRPARLWALAISDAPKAPRSEYTIDVWNHDTYQKVVSLLAHEPAYSGPGGRHLDYVHFLAFSPDGGLLASAGHDGTVRVWSVPDGGLLATATGHVAPVRYVAFARDGSRFLSGSEDGTVRVWGIRGPAADGPAPTP
jgi:WD40 repeat protein